MIIMIIMIIMILLGRAKTLLATRAPLIQEHQPPPFAPLSPSRYHIVHRWWWLHRTETMMIASYTDDEDHPDDDSRKVHC